MTKMGMHNRITAERFHAIKGAVALGESDDVVMRAYQIRSTTLRYIKQSKSFYEYRLRTEKCKMRGKMPKVILPVCGMELIDYQPRKNRRAREKEEKPIYAQDEDRVYAAMCTLILVGAVLMAVAMIGMCVFIVMMISGK